MSYLNKVQLIGNAGAVPEKRFMPNGTPTTRLRLATTEVRKDRESGEKKERTEWHNVTLYARLAEIAAEYVGKGDKVYIEGRLRTRKWVGDDGADRYTTEIVTDDLKLFPKRKPTADGKAAEESGLEHVPAPNRFEEDFDDDIPF